MSYWLIKLEAPKKAKDSVHFIVNNTLVDSCVKYLEAYIKIFCSSVNFEPDQLQSPHGKLTSKETDIEAHSLKIQQWKQCCAFNLRLASPCDVVFKPENIKKEKLRWNEASARGVGGLLRVRLETATGNTYIVSWCQLKIINVHSSRGSGSNPSLISMWPIVILIVKLIP